MARTYTEHRLTDAMLKRLAAMHNRQPHGYGTSLAAILDRGGLVRVRVPRCPDCGTEFTRSEHRHNGRLLALTDGIPRQTDRLVCNHGHESLRKQWGGCYQYDWELTEAGRKALAQARKEGW